MSAHTRLAKEAIEQVFVLLQEEDKTSLAVWARENLDTFYAHLFPKLLPVQMQHSGDGGGPLYVVIADPRNVVSASDPSSG